MKVDEFLKKYDKELLTFKECQEISLFFKF